MSPLSLSLSWIGWFAARLSRVSRIISKTLAVPCPKLPAAPYRRPVLEVLEDRTIPSATIPYGGGPTIPHVQVNNIVMGSQPVNTTALMQALVRDYLPLLGPYYGIGTGTLRSAINVPRLPGNPSNTQIQNDLLQELNSGAIPPPDGNQVYFVFLAPGQVVSNFQGTDTQGYHSGFFVTHDASGYHPVTFFPVGTPILPVYYAVTFGNEPVSITASHELAEAVTDPTGTGYRDPSNSSGGEVADIYELDGSFTLDGYPVSILADPQGLKIAILPPATPQNLLVLAFEQVEALALQYASMLNPSLSPYAQAAKAVLNDNLLYGTSQGQVGVLLGEMVFANWLSQQKGG